MKIFRLGVICLTIYLAALSPIQAKQKLSYNDIISKYIESSCNGNNALWNEILDENARITVSGDYYRYSYNKRIFVDFSQNNEGVVLNCEVNYEILKEFNGGVIIRVVKKFPTNTQINTLTIKESKDTQKMTISKIETTFE